MKAIDFYKASATNIVDVPRPRHPEDPSGIAGVWQATPAEIWATGTLVLSLDQACRFAEAYARAAARTCETSLTLPEHKCGLFLTHNEHRDYYEKLPEYLAERELEDTFESPEAMQRAIDTDEHWHLQWYPETPVGFFHVSAPTLEEVLKMAARTCETKEKM